MITRYRSGGTNLRTQFERIIKRAGVEPYPKLFQNLRASRETELLAEHPIHVVCAWMGHSALVSQKHYAKVREEDFELATGKFARQIPKKNKTESGGIEGSLDLQKVKNSQQ